MTTILIADDQPLVRYGLRKMLDYEPDLEVVGEAVNGEDAIAETARWRPDVVLMDIRMPVVDGIEATRRIVAAAAGHTRVVILTTFDDDELIFGSLQAGASGFLLKDASAEEMIAGIRAAAAGDALLSPSVTRRVLSELGRRQRDESAAAGVAELTTRERDVLVLVARGLSNLEIAGELVVSAATVKTHVANILQKLAVRDRVRAVAVAYEAGLMDRG
jgi:DNA-binding NarL/FixJ family response regulator